MNVAVPAAVSVFVFVTPFTTTFTVALVLPGPMSVTGTETVADVGVAETVTAPMAGADGSSVRKATDGVVKVAPDGLPVRTART